MKDLVEVIAKALVDNPDEVVVTEKAEGKTVTVELHVAPSDMGKVIGKQGRIDKAYRKDVVKLFQSLSNDKALEFFSKDDLYFQTFFFSFFYLSQLQAVL